MVLHYPSTKVSRKVVRQLGWEPPEHGVVKSINTDGAVDGNERATAPPGGIERSGSFVACFQRYIATCSKAVGFASWYDFGKKQNLPWEEVEVDATVVVQLL